MPRTIQQIVSIDQDFIHDKHYALVDGYGRVRGFYDGLSQDEINKLIGDINLLLKRKPESVTAPTNAQRVHPSKASQSTISGAGILVEI